MQIFSRVVFSRVRQIPSTPTIQDLRLVVNSNAIGYGNLTLEREVIDTILNEIDLTEMIERLIGESKLDELKKLDPFGILQKVEDAITERIDVEVIKRFNPSGQISFGFVWQYRWTTRHRHIDPRQHKRNVQSSTMD